MKNLSVIKNTPGIEGSVLVRFFGESKAESKGPISTPAKQVTFFMWCESEIEVGTEFTFDVLKRDGKRMSKIELVHTESGLKYICDVLYDERQITDEDTGEVLDVTLKYLEVSGTDSTEEVEEESEKPEKTTSKKK
tara:strand:+ start:418 stop:825 length:408 start_codon:yes stop_codon:yes gene_type:complete